MKLIIFVIFITLCSIPTLGQSSQWTTSLLVQHPDAKIAASMTDTLTNELRSLKNVTIVKNDGQLQIVVMMITVPDHTPYRYAVAVEIMQRATTEPNERRWILLTGNVNIVEANKVKSFAEMVTARFKRLLEN